MLYPNKDVPICDLQIGDVVRVFDGPWGTATVQRIDAGAVHFFRPYGHASLSCRFVGNSLICYQGLEKFTRPLTDSSTVHLYQRAEESDFEIPFKLAREKAEVQALLDDMRRSVIGEDSLALDIEDMVNAAQEALDKARRRAK